METLKKRAFPIDYPIKVMKGGFDPQEGIYKPKIEGFDRCYNVKAQILTFITEGKQYVIPYRDEFENTLSLSGFTQNINIYVPFCHGGFPIEEAEKWTKLMLYTL